MHFFIVFLCFVRIITESNARLKVVHSWKYIDYEWESNVQKSNAITAGYYDVMKNVPYDVQVAPDGRTFVTVVRDKGVPASLTTISNKVGDGGPLLKPYPSWGWASTYGCAGITGVYRVAIDDNNHLWVLDTGKIGDSVMCPAQLLQFDLRTDQLVKKIVIPYDIAMNDNGTGLLVTPVVYNAKGNTWVYMADTEGYGLVVWNGKSLRRIEASAFKPQKNAEEFTTDGKSFHLEDGILGLSIAQDDRKNPLLFFRPFASFDMYYTPLKGLNRASSSNIKYTKEPSQLKSQSAAQAFSSKGILFYSSLTGCKIICWNRHKPFNDENNVVVDTDTTNLVFASGMKVTRGRLWVLTNHYERVATNTLNSSDINFRILTGTVHSLVNGSNCE